MAALKTYKVHNDPCHGWIAVKRAELETLGIAAQISSYSYQRGDTVYLEEDSDASRWFAARKDAGNPLQPSQFIGTHTDKRSPIRSYASYKP